jgi:hypothetical protein
MRRLTFLGRHTERKHVAGRPAHFIHASDQRPSWPASQRAGPNRLGRAI